MYKRSHFNWRAAISGSLLAAALTACGGDDFDAPPAAPEIYQVTLTGDQEAPAAITTAANGNATLTLDRNTRTVSASLTVDGLVPTLAHIHAAEAGVAGPVALPMTVAGNSATLAPTVLTVEQLATLDAGGFYFNVHSAAHAGGEIRGQIGREVFTAQMTGAQETNAVESAATGSGRLVLDPATRKVSGEIELQGIQATAAHVHSAPFGSDGAIRITLEDHGGHGHFTVPAGTVLTPEDIDKLRSGGMYFNAHSAAHTGGEIRGQIGRRVFLASASGTQEVPSTGSTATGRGFVTYDSAKRTVAGKLTLTGIAATLAHIHQAPAGTNGPVIVPLTQAAAGSSDWLVPSTTPALTVERAQALLTEGLYYNAHSAAFPGGEIRGQLRAATTGASGN
jgi:hypothetical protein